MVNAETGQVADRIDCDAFGRLLSDTNPGFQPFRFAGVNEHEKVIHERAFEIDPSPPMSTIT